MRDLIEIYDREIAMLEPEIHRWLRDDAGYWAAKAKYSGTPPSPPP